MPPLVSLGSHVGAPARLAAIALAALLVVLPAAAAAQSGPAAAGQPAATAGAQTAAPADKAPSEFKWNWDNTMTYGLGYRLSDPDKAIIGARRRRDRFFGQR